MESRPVGTPQGNVKGVLTLLGLCLAAGALVTYFQGQWSGAPSNTPDCSDDIVIRYDPEGGDAPASLFVHSLGTVFEIPRDTLLKWTGPIRARLEKGGSMRIRYNEVVCEHDVSSLYLGRNGERVLKFDVHPGGGSKAVKTRQLDGGAWELKIVALPEEPAL